MHLVVRASLLLLLYCYCCHQPVAAAAAAAAAVPDGVQRGLIAEIVGRFERKGYKLVGIKVLVPSQVGGQSVSA